MRLVLHSNSQVRNAFVEVWDDLCMSSWPWLLTCFWWYRYIKPIWNGNRPIWISARWRTFFFFLSLENSTMMAATCHVASVMALLVYTNPITIFDTQRKMLNPPSLLFSQPSFWQSRIMQIIQKTILNFKNGRHGSWASAHKNPIIIWIKLLIKVMLPVCVNRWNCAKFIRMSAHNIHASPKL